MPSIPPFEPHPLLKGGHAQTIAGRYLPGRRVRLPSTYHRLSLNDGDALALLESTPEGWRAGDPVALLIHGLAGTSTAPYVRRLGGRLRAEGFRAVRMELRGAGLGFGMARETYHAGRSEDARAALGWIADRAPGSPIGLVGYSLGANIALKLAAEAVDRPVPGLDCVLAANPPLDLAACCRHIAKPGNRLYDRNFARSLRAEVERLHRAFPDLGASGLGRIRSLYEFDDLYTAPRNGFGGAEAYYERSSSGPLVAGIRLPGIVIHALDDPFIPREVFDGLQFGPSLDVEFPEAGGHLGYLSRRAWRGDRRWLDSRLLTWLETRWGLEPID